MGQLLSLVLIGKCPKMCFLQLITWQILIKNCQAVFSVRKVILLACTPQPQRIFLNILRSSGKCSHCSRSFQACPPGRGAADLSLQSWPAGWAFQGRSGLALGAVVHLHSPSRSRGGQGLPGSGRSAGCHEHTGYFSRPLWLAHKVTSIATHF